MRCLRRSRIATPQGPGTTKEAVSFRKPSTTSPPQGRTPAIQSTSNSRQGHPFDPGTPVPTPANPPAELTPAHHHSLQLSKPTAAHNPSAPTGPATPSAGCRKQRERGLRIVGVELADEAIRLADLPAAREPTVMVLGHEQQGIPPEALDLLDTCVEIPMIGTGASLNVAVAGSLALYRLAGLL
ncbi:TrmH family RNA methyltransferase [Streptomyces sp. NBC_01589]|uniref:TrmH family RNA methyltransferase n=1 Tax=unclassified Streptomyces TaxID=2593676 RepID=UPI00386FFD9A